MNLWVLDLAWLPKGAAINEAKAVPEHIFRLPERRGAEAVSDCHGKSKNLRASLRVKDARSNGLKRANPEQLFQVGTTRY